MNIELENHLDILSAELKMIRRAARNVADCLVSVEQRLASIRMLLDTAD